MRSLARPPRKLGTDQRADESAANEKAEDPLVRRARGQEDGAEPRQNHADDETTHGETERSHTHRLTPNAHAFEPGATLGRRTRAQNSGEAVQSFSKVAVMVCTASASVRMRPTSRLWSSDVGLRFSEPMYALVPSAMIDFT